MQLHRHTLYALYLVALFPPYAAAQDNNRAAGPPASANASANQDPYFTPTEANSTSYMPQVIIRGIRQDRAGNIWFATFGGPIRYDGKNFTNFGEQVGLPNTRIFSLLEDRTGALWFGSITGGASRYDGKSFTKFTEKDGLGNNDVFWIFEDSDANIWLGTGNGASRYDGKSITNFTTKDGLAHNSVYAITQDATGRIWFGTEGGISFYDGKSFSNLADQVGRPFANMRSTAVDHSGNIWFGGQGGAFRFDGKTLTTFTSKDGLRDDFVGSIIVDHVGNVWLGHPGAFGGGGGGASRYDGKSFTQLTQKDGLGSQTVYCMLEDKAGYLWFGSVDAGACRYDGKTFTYFSAIAAPSLQAAPATQPATAGPPPHMAPFARLVGGEWQVTFASGERAFQAWHWGPGKYSLRKMPDASGDSANPWAGEVFYWHPGRKQVRMLSMHEDIPGVGRGVAEGTMRFEGETADGIFDLYQPRGPRKIGSHWVFDGPDKYRDTLLEDTGAGLKPMNQWDFVRIKDRPTTRSSGAEVAPQTLSKHLRVFESLVGRAWQAKRNSAASDARPIQSTFAWIPSLEVVCARVTAPSSDGESTHLLDAYIYHHVGTDAVRCLALSNRGGVYEGDLTVLDDGSLQLDLKGYEGDHAVPHIVRFDFEQNGTVRQRVWSLSGAERTLNLDVHHEKSDPR